MSTGMPLSSKCSSRFSSRTTTKMTEAPRKREINERTHERGVEVKELGHVRFSLALPRLSSIGDAGRRCICKYIAMIKQRRRRKAESTDSKVHTDVDYRHPVLSSGTGTVLLASSTAPELHSNPITVIEN